MSTAMRTLRKIFVALECRQFQWFWLGCLAMSSTFQMGMVVQEWLVYRLTVRSLLWDGWALVGT